ncbi:hypothetical protein [Nostoc sp. DSM 114167]|uniref:hypothetical protein n=1 Tax=Nostoc sp. DSM 114167 TaxID=3439050 RepID=UPI004045E069
MNDLTPHYVGARFMFNAPFPRNNGADCFGHNPRRWRKPPFRLLCQVAHAVGGAIAAIAIHQAVTQSLSLAALSLSWQ